MPLQAPPTPPGAPTLPAVSGQVTVDGVAVSSPQSVYQAFRAQRRELGRQLESLENDRQGMASQVEQTDVSAAVKKGLEQRITAIDARIADVDKQIAVSDAQVARSASVPGAAVEMPEPRREGPPEEAFFLMGMIIVFGIFPIAIAYSRRIWRRSAKVITTIPQELTDRLMRVEQTVESTAVEIERIGEGQRFMTRVMTEGTPMHTLPASAAKPEALPARPGDIRP